MAFLNPGGTVELTVAANEKLAINAIDTTVVINYKTDVVGMPPVWYPPTTNTVEDTSYTTTAFSSATVVRLENKGIRQAEYDTGSVPLITSEVALLAYDSSVLRVVAAASTFDSITASLATGVGTKLTAASGGAHGLSDAVCISGGATHIYITWASGDATDGFYELLDCDTATDSAVIDLTYATGLGTPTVKKVTEAITLETITVPANSVGPSGVLEIEALFGATKSTGDKTIALAIGGQTLISKNIKDYATFHIDQTWFNRGSTLIGQATSDTVKGLSTTAAAAITYAATTAASLTLKATFETANEVVSLHAYKVSTKF